MKTSSVKSRANLVANLHMALARMGSDPSTPEEWEAIRLALYEATCFARKQRDLASAPVSPRPGPPRPDDVEYELHAPAGQRFEGGAHTLVCFGRADRDERAKTPIEPCPPDCDCRDELRDALMAGVTDGAT